jgi:tetratricopeptide (TPR) repeat protein
MTHDNPPPSVRGKRGWHALHRGCNMALLLFLPATGLIAANPPPAELLRQATAAEARFDTKAALALLLQADAAQPGDAAIQQKISRQYSDLALDTPDAAGQKRLCTEALRYSQRAVELQPANAINLVSLAISYGKLGELCDTRTEVNYSRLVKQYAEQALTVDPDCDYAHHVLGRWHYAVASLDSASRFIAWLVYGGLPGASTAEAVRHLRRAVELAPGLPGHRLELGFALLADGQRRAARAAFEQGLAMPQREKYEVEVRERARAELAKLGRD